MASTVPAPAQQGYSVTDDDIPSPASPPLPSTTNPPAASPPPPASPPAQPSSPPTAAPVAQAKGTPSLPERLETTDITPTAAPTATGPAPGAGAQTQDVDDFSHPQVAELHAIFPDFDASLLLSVLESVGGDQDRAVDTLLGMSDPEHISTAVPEQPAAVSQTDLDEQFARQLMLEEEERFSRRQGRATGESWQPRSQQQQQEEGVRGQASPPRDTMAEVQDQFSKLAESGKRTFSSLMSKVKAKVQEFDQPKNQGQSGSGSEGTQPNWGTSYGTPQPGLDRHATQAYYAPRVAPDRVQPPSQPPPPSTPPGMTGHDFVNDPTPRDTPPPPSTNSGPPTIDPSKVGLLPKRPVSLLDANAGSRGPPHDDEDDELEYVENPFEERRH